MAFPIEDCCGVIWASLGEQIGKLTTGPTGEFKFEHVPSGRFEIKASKIGRRFAAWGESSSFNDGRWIDVRDGEFAGNLTVVLWKAATISGHVVDERGDPATGITVVANTGRLHYFATTDDRGFYELVLPPADYLLWTEAYPAIAGTSTWRPSTAFSQVFYPGLAAREPAARLRLSGAQELTDINFSVQPGRVFRVNGVFTSGGTLPPGTAVKLFRIAADGQAEPVSVAEGGGARTFRFDSVPPGRYLLRAMSLPEMPYMTHGTAPLRDLPAGHSWWADRAIAVIDRDVDLELPLQTGARISGRVEFDGARPLPTLEELRARTMRIERADGLDSDFRGAYLPENRFATIELPPGRYIVNPGAPEGWLLKSVIAGGRDIRDYSFDVSASDIKDVVITFTDRRSAISGRLVREGPDDNTRGWITIFPVDRNWWAGYGQWPRRLVSIQAGASGFFEAAVPPGTYYVAASRNSTRGRLTPGELGDLVKSAATVVVGEGEVARQDVKFPKAR